MFDQRSNLSLKREWKAVQTDYVIYCIFHELIVLHFHVVLEENKRMRLVQSTNIALLLWSISFCIAFSCILMCTSAFSSDEGLPCRHYEKKHSIRLHYKDGLGLLRLEVPKFLDFGIFLSRRLAKKKHLWSYDLLPFLEHYQRKRNIAFMAWKHLTTNQTHIAKCLHNPHW